MLVLGIDAHKRTHTVVAVDDAGRKLGQHTTTSATTAGHLELVRWAVQFGGDRRWAVKDCRHLSRRLERDLLTAGEAIVRVPPKMMAHARDAARSYGKSDPSTPWRLPGQHCVNRTCRRYTSTMRPAKCDYWSITVRT